MEQCSSRRDFLKGSVGAAFAAPLAWRDPRATSVASRPLRLLQLGA